MGQAELNKAYFESGDWCKLYYKGIQMLKYTTDLWQYMNILEATQPDLIIETGTLKGASALFFNDHSKARVITMDIVNQVENQHPAIEYRIGDSLEQSFNIKKYKRVMVVLDSDHGKAHVAAELKKYAPLVSRGCYLVVEDTFISDYLGNSEYPNGSVREALTEWDSTGFEQQPDMFALSMNPGGWFKRV
jgi:cephalosporin hydroxylase